MDHSQQYNRHKLEKFNLFGCKSNDVPMVTSAAAKMQKGTEAEHVLAKTPKNLSYRELTGSLQYPATMTRADISWAVNKLSSYDSCWTEAQFRLAKGVLRYVAGTRDWGLRLAVSKDDHRDDVDADFNVLAIQLGPRQDE